MGNAVKRYPIVLSETFIRATRDTGYNSTAAAVAELVDNSIQARATNIHVFVRIDSQAGPDNLTISVLDNGRGMDAPTLRRAMQFGGSSRFDDRAGPGRFGMGLPNASVSQSRRVDVYTWRGLRYILGCNLDVDQIAAGMVDEIPPVRRSTLPEWTRPYRGISGTLVCWSRCDRLDHRRPSTVARKLHEPLGRMFRRFLWSGVTISINGEEVHPIDPLFLHPSAPLQGTTAFGELLIYEVRDPRNPDRTSTVSARFALLPVADWYDLPLEEKRRLRITGGAGMSVLRAGREIDYGWFFFGSKRRENYDDWWRCELSFEPALDEMFGVTHSKQSINPSAVIKDILTPDLEAVARALNGRVQDAFQGVKLRDQERPAVRTANDRDQMLPPIPPRRAPMSTGSEVIGERAGATQAPPPWREGARRGYEIKVRASRSPAFYECANKNGNIEIIINKNHPFYKYIFSPVSEGRGGIGQHELECLLLAVARAEAEADTPAQCRWYAQKRLAWSDALAVFLEQRK